MICAALLPILTSQIVAPEKAVTCVITDIQRQINLAESVNAQTTEEDIEKKFGLSTTRYEINETVVFVTEDAYPIESYKKTIEWVNQSVNGLTSFFDPSSKNGHLLLEYIQSRSFTKSFDSPPGAKPIGIGLGVTIKNPLDPSRAPFISLIDHPNAGKTGIATVAPFMGTELEISKKAREMRNKPTLFPHQRRRNEIIVTQYESGKVIPLRAQSLADTIEIQNKLSVELRNLEAALKKEIESAIERMMTGAFSDYKGGNKNFYSLNELPKQVRDFYVKNVVNDYENFGFGSKEEAQAYMENNPNLEVNFSLTAFQFSRYPGKTDGPINALGLYINP